MKINNLWGEIRNENFPLQFHKLTNGFIFLVQKINSPKVLLKLCFSPNVIVSNYHKTYNSLCLYREKSFHIVKFCNYVRALFGILHEFF